MEKITDNIFALIIIGMLGGLTLVVSFVLINIRNRNHILRQQKKIQEAEIAHQKELLQSVIASQEAERKRIGMDLHDEVGAALSTLRMKIERYGTEYNLADEFSVNCKSDIDRIISNMRSISHSLSPRISGNFGFYDAIHELSDAVNRSGAVDVVIDIDENNLPVFASEQVAMALYRVFTELVNNTLKHAEAKHIVFAVNVLKERIEMRYSDDGKGITVVTDHQKKGMGLQNIESRLSMIGATWEEKNSGTGGYELLINLPVN